MTECNHVWNNVVSIEQKYVTITIKQCGKCKDIKAEKEGNEF